MTERETNDGISRRQALTRLAAAGAVAWVTPAVQTLNMSRAHAQTSPPTENCYSIAFLAGGTATCYEYNGSNFQCDVNPAFVQPGGCAQGVTINTNGPVFGNFGNRTWIVTIPAGCTFVTGWTHGGPRSLCEQNATAVVNGDGTTTVTFYPNSDVPGDGHYGISNVQMTFCCGANADAIRRPPSRTDETKTSGGHAGNGPAQGSSEEPAEGTPETPEPSPTDGPALTGGTGP